MPNRLLPFAMAGLMAAIAIGVGAWIMIQTFGKRPQHSREESVHFEEATALAEATEAYRLHYGAYPPESSTTEIERHLQQFHSPLNLPKQEIETLTQLDAAERVVFWLGGGTSNAKLQRIYEFEVYFLADDDNDGFQEMIANDGNPYQFIGNTIAVDCDATSTLR